MLDCMIYGNSCDAFINSSYGLQLGTLHLQLRFKGITEAQLIADQNKQRACRRGIATVLDTQEQDVRITKIGSHAIPIVSTRWLAARVLEAELIVEFEIYMTDPDVKKQMESFTASEYSIAIQQEATNLGITDFTFEIAEIDRAKLSETSQKPSFVLTVALAGTAAAVVTVGAVLVIKRRGHNENNGSDSEWSDIYPGDDDKSADRERAISMGLGNQKPDQIEFHNPMNR